MFPGILLIFLVSFKNQEFRYEGSFETISINIGNETRQIIGGLKLSYSKEELLGKQVLVLENATTQTNGT